MNKEVEINKFLKEWANIYKDNEDIAIVPDTMFSALTDYDFNDIDRLADTDNSKLFEEIIDNYKDSKNIKVFVDKKRPYHLEVINSNDLVSSESVKLHLNIKEEGLKDTSRLIFDCIDNNNIAAACALINKDSSESMVIRVYSYNDAKSLVSAINQSSVMKKNSRKNNPFMVNDGVVSITYDKYFSYLEVLSYLLSDYLNYKKDNNDLDNVSSKDLESYIKNVYSNIFTNFKDLDNITKTRYFQKALNNTSKGEALVNLEAILVLIINQFDSNYKMKDFESLYKKYTNPDTINNLSEYYTALINNRSLIFNGNNQRTADTIIENFVHHEIEEGKIKGEIYEELLRFSEGEVNVITTHDNYRVNFKKYVNQNSINRALNKIDRLTTESNKKHIEEANLSVQVNDMLEDIKKEEREKSLLETIDTSFLREALRENDGLDELKEINIMTDNTYNFEDVEMREIFPDDDIRNIL